MYSKDLAGFTLAEVLITLGIIGVVAAMTLPAVITNYKAVTLKTGLNAAYSLIGQAIERMRADDISVLPLDYANNTFEPVFVKYFDGALDCKTTYTQTNQTECLLHANMGGFAGVADTETYKNFSKNNSINSLLLDDGQFVMKNGMLVLIENQNLGSLFITVDVNGKLKKPNAWGHDMFTFQLTQDGKLLPMGVEGTSYNEDEYCSKTSSDNKNGIACTAKALGNADYFKNLP